MDFESEEKNGVLCFYPNAICEAEYREQDAKWQIIENGKILATSYQNEKTAWTWALLLANNRLLNKLGG